MRQFDRDQGVQSVTELWRINRGNILIYLKDLSASDGLNFEYNADIGQNGHLWMDNS